MAKCEYCGRKMKKIKHSLVGSKRCVEYGPHSGPLVRKLEKLKSESESTKGST